MRIKTFVALCALACLPAAGETLLKQSTAATVVIGPFVDDTDGVTTEEALTISQADIRLTKNGGTFAQTNNGSGASHMENGYYSVPLDTTDTDTLGRLRVSVNESGALPVWRDFQVVPANVHDSLVGGSDTLQGDTTQWNGSNVATPDSAGHPVVTVKDGTGTGEIDTASGTILLRSATETQIDAIETDTNSLNDTKIGQTLNLTASGNIGIDWANVENPTTALDLAGTDIQLVDTTTTNTDMRGTDSAFLAANAPPNISDLAIVATTGEVGINLDDTQGTLDASEIGTDAITAAKIAASALTEGDEIAGFNDLSTAEVNTEVDTALTDIALDHLLAASVTGTDVTDDSAIAFLVSASATADWDDYVNTTESLQALRDRGDAAWITATGFSTHDAADIWTAGTRTLTANDNLNDPTAATVADAIWDEAIGDHSSAGSTGEALNNASAPTASTVADAVWDETLSDHISSGSAGGRLDRLPDAAAGGVDGLPTVDGNNYVAGVQGTVNTLDGLNDLTAAQVNAEMDTGLSDIHLDRLFAAAYDPASAPGAADALLNELVEDDGGIARYTSNALEQAPGGGNVTVGDLTQAALAKFVTADTGETAASDNSVAKIAQGAAGGNVTVGDITSAALAKFATTDTGETAGAPGSVVRMAARDVGTGDTAVNHDTGGTDNMTVLDSNNAGIDGATITAYLKSDYDAGNQSTPFIKGSTKTKSDGTWVDSLWLDSGTYTIRFEKIGVFDPNTKEITVP